MGVATGGGGGETSPPSPLFPSFNINPVGLDCKESISECPVPPPPVLGPW